MKTFIESIDTFIELTEVVGYRNDLLVFKSFIETKQINDYTWLNYLSGINTDVIIDSLNYYIVKNKVSSVSTAKRYASAVKEFFSFMFENNYIFKNSFFHELSFKFDNEESYSYQINRAISKNQGLKDAESVAFHDETDSYSLMVQVYQNKLV
jgi:site-specific recombinase XerD